MNLQLRSYGLTQDSGWWSVGGWVFCAVGCDGTSATQYKILGVKRTALIRRSIYTAIVLVLSVAMPFVFAQSPTKAATTLQSEFEVVSIHMVDPHATGNPSRSFSSFPTNLFELKGAPLAFLVQFAYNIERQEYISAMPGWMDTQEYDISAKVEGGQQLTLEQMRPMLQRILEQRFHFVLHRETKITSGFTLVVAKGGPRLQPSKDNSKPFAQILSNRLDVRHADTGHIAGVLAHHVDQPVVDKTGLTGIYDFTLSYAPANDSNSSLPDFFTALQEQLGLRLESQKVPVDFLVIDHIDRVPTEN
jgi:uncharacterized protein (TIGR03435 family)